jgi:hypothetical protein
MDGGCRAADAPCFNSQSVTERYPMTTLYAFLTDLRTEITAGILCLALAAYWFDEARRRRKLGRQREIRRICERAQEAQ